MSGAPKPMRLPPVKVLRVKNPNKKPEQPCMQLMSSVLGTQPALSGTPDLAEGAILLT